MERGKEHIVIEVLRSLLQVGLRLYVLGLLLLLLGGKWGRMGEGSLHCGRTWAVQCEDGAGRRSDIGRKEIAGNILDHHLLGGGWNGLM